MSKPEKYIECVMFSDMFSYVSASSRFMTSGKLGPILLCIGPLPLNSPDLIITAVFLTLNFTSINIFKTGRHFTHFSSW